MVKKQTVLTEWPIFATASRALGAVLADMVYSEREALLERERPGIAASVSGTLVARQVETINLALNLLAEDVPLGGFSQELDCLEA